MMLIASFSVVMEPAAKASSCSFDQMVARDNPALWFNFDGVGVPTNQGSAQTTVKLVGDEPTFGENTRCGSAYNFKALGGRYSAQGLQTGTLSDGEFTIETSMKIPRQIAVTYPTIFNISTPGWGALRVRTTDSNSGKVEYAIFNPGEQGFYSPGIVDDNQYHLLTVVHKAGRARFFIDGVLNFERAINGPFNYDDSLLYIGGSGTVNETFPGSIDHFAIYSGSLSDAAVGLHFQSYLKDFYDAGASSAGNSATNVATQIAAPISAPQSFNLTAFANGITASWVADSNDATSVKVEINCNSSGVKTSSVSARQRETSFQGLTPGEVCSGQIYAQNAGGTSPPSPRIANIVIRGAGPITPAVASASLNGSEVSVSVSNVDPTATEVVVELSCTKSGSRFLTTTPKNSTITFGAIVAGDVCYSNATAKNLWGSAPRGSNSNSISLNGEKPQPINYSAQSTSPGELKISWPAQGVADVTISISVVCRQSSKLTQEVSISQLQSIFSNLTPGDFCTSTVIARNIWGTANPVTKEEISIIGKPPVGEPVVKMARTKLTTMALSWESNPSATYMNIRIFCTTGGNRTVNIELPVTETEISGRDGDSCYTVLRWANAWGFASETINTPLLKLSSKAPTPPAANKKILCVKGKNSLTIVGKNPICPTGYKKKAASK